MSSGVSVSNLPSPSSSTAPDFHANSVSARHAGGGRDAQNSPTSNQQHQQQSQSNNNNNPNNGNNPNHGVGVQLRALGSLLMQILRGKRQSGQGGNDGADRHNDEDIGCFSDRHEALSWHGHLASNAVSKDPSMYSVCPENCDDWLFIDDDA